MVEILWLGHASFQLTLDNQEVIVVDPWLQSPTFPKDHKFSRIDTILVTHGHFDHLSDAVSLARQFPATVVSNYEISVWLESKGIKNTLGMNKGGTVQVGSVKVTMTDARHSSGILDNGKIIDGGEPAGYVIHLPDGRAMYFAGDTNVFADMDLIRQLYAPQLAVLPIGGLYTMGPKEAALACRLLRPQKVIPSHYGTFPPLAGRPEQLAELIRDLEGVEVWPVEIGKPVQW